MIKIQSNRYIQFKQHQIYEGNWLQVKGCNLMFNLMKKRQETENEILPTLSV